MCDLQALVAQVVEREKLARTGKAYFSTVHEVVYWMFLSVFTVDSTCGLAEALENEETPAKSRPATSSCGNVSFATLHRPPNMSTPLQ